MLEMFCLWPSATPCLRVIKLEIFACDHMQLHACAWSRWRCLLVIKWNSMFACDQAGPWTCLLVIKCNSMLARGQTGDVCSWSDATPCLRVIKLEIFCSWLHATPGLIVIKQEMFACHQMQLHVCVARAFLSDGILILIFCGFCSPINPGLRPNTMVAKSKK